MTAGSGAYAGSRLGLTINGKAVSGVAGQTILDVARENGIRIPTLCYSPKIEPVGSCRLCLVEIEGVATPATACTTPIRDGMVVETHTPAVEMLRRETLKLLLLRHPLNCAACEIGGACELEELVHEYDISHADLHAYELDPLDLEMAPYATPLIAYHPLRCIVCGRCVAACTEITGAGAIAIQGSGATARIAPAARDSGERIECVSCGECLAICPVNALTPAEHRPRHKPWETRAVQTTCAYCGVGCQLELNVADNTVVGVSPHDDGVNHGALCVKGRFGYGFVNHEERLTDPLIREGDGWRIATWDEALELVGQRFADICVESGGDAIAGLSSARCTNEENYLFQKFFRGILGTNNVDHCARL